MGKGSGGSGMTRGDRRRNARRERLREMLPRDGAVIGIDLGDEKQAIAVVDHDVRVLARKTVRVKAFRLGEALDWAVAQARAKGFTAVAVACEPTGARWLQVQRLCAERGLPLVCIQPLVSHIARQQQDYTTHKSDESDCVMIARLAIELHCYVPEELDEAWAQLRHLGRRRAQLITSATASVQRVRDFLSVAWPVAPEACAHPFTSVTWLAAMQVVTSRCGGQPEKRPPSGWRNSPPWSARPWPGGAASGPPAWYAGPCSPRWPAPRGWWYPTGGRCCGGAPMSWVTCSAPAPSCGPWRPTWPPCWASSACHGWRTSPG